MIDNLHIASVFLMTGIIWLIQLVHYPSFKFVDLSRWKDFHRFHSFWITPLVAPLMLIQLGSSFFLSHGVFLAAGLSISVFAVTFLISVPLHNKLAESYNFQTINLLIKTNWIRTALWSVHCFWLLTSSK